MKKVNGYSVELEVEGETYIVSIFREGTGLKAVWYSFVSNYGITLDMSGYPVDQRQAKEPKVYTPEEIMDMAVNEAYDFIPDLDRMNQFNQMLFDFMDQVDANREKSKAIAEWAKSYYGCN